MALLYVVSDEQLLLSALRLPDKLGYGITRGDGSFSRLGFCTKTSSSWWLVKTERERESLTIGWPGPTLRDPREINLTAATLQQGSNLVLVLILFLLRDNSRKNSISTTP